MQTPSLKRKCSLCNKVGTLEGLKKHKDEKHPYRRFNNKKRPC